MKDKFAIVIGRQLGSGGHAVGESIAAKLGVKCYDKELITLAAEESGMASEVFEKRDEKSGELQFSSLINYLKAPFAGDDGHTSSVLSGESLFKIESDIIREIAGRESAVFVGRCADYILRDHPQCLSVFVSADERERLERIGERNGCGEEQARQKMERGDRLRAEYYNYYSSGNWGEASSYDLCINSSLLGVERTAEFIVDFARKIFKL